MGRLRVRPRTPPGPHARPVGGSCEERGDGHAAAHHRSWTGAGVCRPPRARVWIDPPSVAADHAALLAKLDAVRSLGVSHFALFMDDSTQSNATATAALANDLDDYVRMHDPTDHLIVVGVRYAFGPNAYTDALGAMLRPGIDVMWTGNDIEPHTYAAGAASAQASYDAWQPVLSAWQALDAPATPCGGFYPGWTCDPMNHDGIIDCDGATHALTRLPCPGGCALQPDPNPDICN